MKTTLPLSALFSIVFLSLAPLSHAQDPDDETSDAIKQASEAAKKMGMKMPDVKKMMEESDKEEAREKAATQAALQAAVAAPGPVALPEWTPKVPQFTPLGPVTKKIVDDEARIVLSGTSPLTPAELGDAWEATKLEKTINRGRTNMNINETKTVIVNLSTQDNPAREVRMEAKRAPDEKITHVTLSSPIIIVRPEAND